MKNKFIVLIFLFFSSFASAESPLLPVKTDSPRASMKSFMLAMQDYRSGKESSDVNLEHRILDALRTFNLDSVSHSEKENFAKEAAILLKEVIDRVILIDYDKIPNDEDMLKLDNKKWRLKDTEIEIALVKDGSREGEYLFTEESITRATEFYKKVKHLPYLKASGQGALYSPPWFERKLPTWLMSEKFVIPTWQIIGIFLALLFGIIFKKITIFVMEQFKRLSSKSKNSWDDKFIEAAEESIGSIVSVLFWLASIRLLGFEGNAFLSFDIFLKLLVSYYLIVFVYSMVEVLSDFLAVQAKKTEFPLDDQMVPLIRKSLKVFTIVLGSLVAIQNLGINVMSVLAGLGLGGLAFALAAKDTCANLFGSIMILMDKPCRVGDWVNIGGVEGSIEEIGFRSTKIRTLSSSLVSVPNANLANMNIDNFGARPFRMLNLKLGLTYDSLPEQIEAFAQGVQNILVSNPFISKEKIQVFFTNFGDSSLDFHVLGYLKVPGREEELNERQKILLQILRLARDLKVSFAFPSQSLYLESTPDLPLASKQGITPESLRATSDSFSNYTDSGKTNGVEMYKAFYETKF